MIVIEVLNSTSPYINGQHQNFGNIFTLGKSKKNDLTDSSSQNITLSVENDKLYVENSQSSEFYTVNGKKISGKKSIKVNDEIVHKNLHFKIISFEYSHIDPITDIGNLYKKRTEESPELSEVLTLIEQEFIHLEKLKYHEN